MSDVPLPPSPEGAREPAQMRDTARIAAMGTRVAFESQDAEQHAKCLTMLELIVDLAVTEIEILRLKGGKGEPPEP